MRLRHVALLAVALVAAGCGSTQAGSGRATVWVTRDRGAHVLHVGKVPAGVSAMQAVTRLGKVETKFGGRYLRSVDGVAEHGRRAWFYYVNGYAGTTRPAVVVTCDLTAGRKVARSLHARVMSKPVHGADVLFLDGPGPLRFRAVGAVPPGSPVRLRFTGDWHLLLRRPFPFRFRYTVP